ncbi:MAG: ATP-binding protein [Zoogloeaceae bacterium]|jgi:predicted AAA+ superfamily ATPase|nr:ATP-binding protein [Zoogloeaceae bacterium]
MDAPAISLPRLIQRAEALLERLEALLPPPPPPPDWNAIAFRWRRRGGGQGRLEAVAHPHRIRLKDLRNIDEQKQRIEQNTRQFVAGRRANNVLLTGARGTGKSSLIKALLNQHAKQGLRLIEVDKHDLIDLPDIVDLIAGRDERFIIFCDDLSFEAGESGYKALKSVLDGSVASTPDNVLLYATSNRCHLMPEYMDENLAAQHVDGEIHPDETVEEKLSLSDRFGLWLSFYPFNQDDYLAIAGYWLREYGVPAARIEAAREEALQWALLRGSRSGRSALQFARDYAGRHGVK